MVVVMGRNMNALYAAMQLRAGLFATPASTLMLPPFTSNFWMHSMRCSAGAAIQQYSDDLTSTNSDANHNFTL
eukprot:1792731-Pyramimonas_sp.AAC.1